MNIHGPACICKICAPMSAPARSPSLKPTPTPVTDVELAQAMTLFKAMDDRGRALTFALMSAAVRLAGKRG